MTQDAVGWMMEVGCKVDLVVRTAAGVAEDATPDPRSTTVSCCAIKRVRGSDS
jgi:hypothetical protein